MKKNNKVGVDDERKKGVKRDIPFGCDMIEAFVFPDRIQAESG